MEAKDIQEIVDAMKRSKDEQWNKEKWIDWLFKALIGLLVYFGLEMRKDVATIKENQTQLSQTVLLNQQSILGFSDTITELKGFTRQPRFTEQDFLEKTTPMLNSINRNQLQTSENTLDIQQLTERILELEFERKAKNP